MMNIVVFLIIIVIGIFVFTKIIGIKEEDEKPTDSRRKQNNNLHSKDHFNKANVNQKQSKEEVYISVSDIAKSVNKPVQKIYEMLYSLQWIEKKENWVLATEVGERNGAKQLYNTKTKQKYVMWDMGILKNNELKNIINSEKIQKSQNMYNTIHQPDQKKKMTKQKKKDKGDEYEKYVADFFRKQGYYVWEHGQEKGLKDSGLDLFVKIDKFVYYVQCKNWEKWKLDHNTVQAIQTKIRNLLKQEEGLRKIANGYQQKILFVTSKKCLTPAAYKYIEEHKDILEYHVIPME